MTHAGVSTPARGNQRNTLQTLLVVALVVTVAVFTASVFLRTPGEFLAWADTGLYNLAFIFTALLLYLRSRVAGRGHKAWLTLAAAFAAYAIGNAIYATMGALGFEQEVSLADVFWVAFLPLMFFGLLSLAHSQRGRSVDWMWLDALVVGSGAMVFGLSMINGVLADSSPQMSASLVVNTLYVVGDLVLIGLVAAVAQEANWRMPAGWWVLLAGFLIWAVSDSMYLVLLATGHYVEGGVVDTGWTTSALLVGLAAVMTLRSSQSQTAPGRSRIIAPVVAIVIGVLLGILPAYGPFGWVVKAASLITVLLGALRMVLAVRDSDRLTDLLRRAEVDPLTGLANRRGLQSMTWTRLIGSALVLLDIDRLKDVNDTMGHSAGDRLIQAVAERLTEGLRSDDLISRIGGDEFAIILRETDEAQALRIAEELVRLLETPFTLQGIPLHVSACAGVTHFTRETRDVEMALRHADIALSDAKAEGVGIVRAYAGRPGERSEERLRMRAQLKAEMVAGGDAFLVTYQPIVRICDRSVYAVEALVRWDLGDRVLQPAEFLPEVIRAGVLGDLTRLMIQKSLRELRAAGLGYAVTVNVPPDVLDDSVAITAREALAASASDPEQLIIEITEDTLIRDPKHAEQVLRDMRELGLRILVDDFGTGYSGLSMLRDYLVDGLKIDYSYVSRLHEDPGAAAIVRAVRVVAEELGMLVIYEGAETDAVVEALAGIDGCLQGFAVARPMPIDDLVRWGELRAL